uniref:RAS p21 protein activator 3 n=1 Tax=Astatotilapia calliptera TaxID=8154 RepID=A0AAX7TLL0_ASTCA
MHVFINENKYALRDQSTTSPVCVFVCLGGWLDHIFVKGSADTHMLHHRHRHAREAKNIPPYPGPNKMRDCYCTVNLDQEEVFRTKIVEKSLCPFYGEDFYCEIPRSFRHLSFYIFDRDVFRRDSSIGKVAVKKEDLQKYHGKDTWFQLQPVSADSEVQVSTKTRRHTFITKLMNSNICRQMGVCILECQGLPIVNGQCDPYAAVSLLGPSRSEAKKTKVKRKTNNPQFEEVFYFEVTRPLSYTKRQFDVEEEDVDKLALRVDLWNASNLKFGDEFLGGVRVPLRVLGQAGVHDAWYFLQPRENGGKSVKVDELGSLRLNIVYTEDHVFPSEHYTPLRDLLLHSANVEPVSASTAHTLGEVCREKQEAAIPLVRLFLHYGKIVPFISAIAHAEINRTQDPNTIFRGNSLTSKCIDETMKLAGMHYLQVTLKPIIDEICTEHKPCEIDPVKLKESENLETNRENLRHYVDRIFNVITTSGVRCPTVMCDIFFSLRESAATRFQVDQDVRYTAVSSFIFLRFFAPAILSPNLFHLRPHHPVSLMVNPLTPSAGANFKESYMAAFYDYFNEQKYADAVKNHTFRREEIKMLISYFSFPFLYRFMIKRAQGRNRFGMKNFKKRWFRLTNHEFTYHRTKGEGALCSIPIENILAVERLEEESFKMKNMFQVIQPERALYIQANNCVEARDWIDILTKVSQCNRKRLSTYHPSAYLNGHWLCCKLSADTAPGCTPCTGGLPANIQLDVDGDRETERIYSLFSTYMTKLIKMQEACGSKSVYDGPEQEEYSTFVIDDPQETYKTLKQIISAVQTLEQQHTKYKRDKFKKTKIGSQEHPIGDKSFQCYIRQQSESSTYSI